MHSARSVDSDSDLWLLFPFTRQNYEKAYEEVSSILNGIHGYSDEAVIVSLFLLHFAIICCCIFGQKRDTTDDFPVRRRRLQSIDQHVSFSCSFLSLVTPGTAPGTAPGTGPGTGPGTLIEIEIKRWR